MKRTVLRLVTLATIFALFLPIRSVAAVQTPALRSGVAVESNGSGTVIINEVMFAPVVGGYEWVELKNGGSSAFHLAGYRLTDEDGNWYRIPAALPDVPPGAFVVVLFDGLGAAGNGLDFADNVATLHTGPGVVDVFEDDADQVALYNTRRLVYLPLVLSGSTGSAQAAAWNLATSVPAAALAASDIVSFVAYGAPLGDDDVAWQAGLWRRGAFKSLARGLGEDTGERLPDETLGRVPNSQSNTVDDWTLYLASQATKGGENPWPVISWYYPPAGAALGDSTFAVSWAPVAGVTGYRFQLDDNSDFSSPEVDETLQEAAYVPSSPVAAGDYHWRVKALFAGGESAWSAGVEIHSLALPDSTANRVTAESMKTLGITWQLQHKDTNMLCLDGDAETGENAWDSPHSSRGEHGENYCVRASVAMLASYYGGKLSQDRISYETFKGGEPELDLGHGQTVTRAQAVAAVEWLWAPCSRPPRASRRFLRSRLGSMTTGRCAR